MGKVGVWGSTRGRGAVHLLGCRTVSDTRTFPIETSDMSAPPLLLIGAVQATRGTVSGIGGVLQVRACPAAGRRVLRRHRSGGIGTGSHVDEAPRRRVRGLGFGLRASGLGPVLGAWDSGGQYSGRRRMALTSPRLFFAPSLRSLDPRVAVVGRRVFGAGARARARIPARRVRAISRLRNWERSSEAVTVRTPRTRRACKRVVRRFWRSSSRTRERAMSQLSSTRESDVLTPCPPGPPEWEKRQCSSPAGTLRRRVTRRSPVAPRPERCAGSWVERCAGRCAGSWVASCPERRAGRWMASCPEPCAGWFAASAVMPPSCPPGPEPTRR